MSMSAHQRHKAVSVKVSRQLVQDVKHIAEAGVTSQIRAREVALSAAIIAVVMTACSPAAVL